MPIKYKIAEELDLIIGYGYGVVAPEEIANGLKKISSEPAFRAGMDRYVFFEDDASISQLNLAAMHELKEASMVIETETMERQQRAEMISYKLAVVCTSPQISSSLKLYQAVWSADTAVNVDVKFFEHQTEATDWLGRPSIPEPIM